MDTATLIAIIGIIALLAMLLSRVGIIYKVIKFAVIVGIGYLTILLFVSAFWPAQAETLMQPLKTIIDLIQTFFRELRI